MKLPNREQLKTIILYMMVILTGLSIMLCFMMLEVVFVMKYELSRPSIPHEYAPGGPRF